MVRRAPSSATRSKGKRIDQRAAACLYIEATQPKATAGFRNADPVFAGSMGRVGRLRIDINAHKE
jgi:hypothetical protein